MGTKICFTIKNKFTAMKFLATLAALAFSAQALNLSADAATEVVAEAEAKVATEAKVDAEVKVEASTEAKADQGYNGPIVPEDYDYAVHSYNLDAPFTDQDCYQKQVDIYSD